MFDKRRSLTRRAAGFGVVATAFAGGRPEAAGLPSLLETAIRNASRARMRSVLVSPKVRVTENGAQIGLLDSQIWSMTPASGPLSFSDRAGSAVGTIGFARDAANRPVAYHVRLRVEDGAVTEIESLITRRGESFVFAADAPAPITGGMLRPLPRSRRRRAVDMLRIVNAYFDGIERADGSNVPAAAKCVRSENGARTSELRSELNGCTGAMKSITTIRSVRDRRFPVVDEDRGLVWALTIFDIPSGVSKLPEGGVLVERRREPRSILFGHLFRIEDGEIAEIVAILRNAPLGSSSGWPPTSR